MKNKKMSISQSMPNVVVENDDPIEEGIEDEEEHRDASTLLSALFGLHIVILSFVVTILHFITNDVSTRHA